MSKSVAQIIDDLGGPAIIAEALAITEGAVRLWRHREKIPRTAWPDLFLRFPGAVSMDELRASEPIKAEIVAPRSEAAA